MNMVLRFLQQARTARGVHLLLVLGIFLRTDATAQSFWQPTSGPPGALVKSLLVAPNGSAFVGTLDGLSRSLDNGDNWMPGPRGAFWSLAANSNGSIFAGTYSGNILRSSDNGTNWTQLNIGATTFGVFALAINANDDIFAGTDGGGIFRSTDNGSNWVSINTDLADSTINALAADSATGTIFAGTPSGIFSSINNGTNWFRVGLTESSVAALVVNINGDVFAGTSNGVFRIPAGDTTWVAFNSGLTLAINELAIHPNGDIFAGGFGGMFISSASVADWIPISAGLPQTSIEGLAISPNGNIFIGTFYEGVFRSDSNGDNWVEANNGLRNVELLSIALNPAGNIFAGASGGYVYRSLDGGSTWARLVADSQKGRIEELGFNSSGHIFAITLFGQVVRSTNNGDNWTSLISLGYLGESLAINASGHIFVGTDGGGVFRSLDNGSNWSAINNGLTNLNVQALAINASGHVFAGTLGGGVFRSLDNGANWTALGNGIPANADIRSFTFTSHGDIFAGSSGAGLFRSSDNGDSWTDLAAVFPGSFVVALAVNDADHIFAGMYGVQVLRSTDNGDSWENVSSGLSGSFIKLAFNANSSIFASTFGNGVYRSVKPTIDIEPDSLALVDLYNSTNGANWINNTNWLSTQPLSTWSGVAVVGRRVTELSLAFNNLVGTIPATIGNLTSLIYLDLHGNLLDGGIPTEIGNLNNLTGLVLGNNLLSGSIPPEIGGLAHLSGLALNHNNLTGGVPTSFTNLGELFSVHVQNNLLTDLPDLSSIPMLVELQIQNNRFTFEDLEPNIGIPEFIYSPQDSVGAAQEALVAPGANLTISVAVGGANNRYQWFKDGAAISGAIDTSYMVTQVDSSRDPGIYICEITNTVATACTLTSRPITLRVVGNALSVTPTPATANNAVTVTATLNVNFQPTTSQLFYRRAGELDFQATTLNQAGNQFSGLIPADFVTLSGAEYYISLSNAQTEFTFPETDPFYAPAVLQVDFSQLGYALALQPEVYKMISVPVELNANAIDSVLLDNYGEYDMLPRQWRIFRWENEAYAEHSNIEARFTPGNAFWLITRAGKSFNVGRGHSVNSAGSVSILLQPGWNQMANPFAFPVDWSSIDVGGNVQAPVFYDGTQFLFDRTILEPWEGYFVFNRGNAPEELNIPPIAAPSAAAKINPRLNFNEKDFVLKVAAVVPGTNLIDSENYLGLREQATAGVDPQDFYDPPPIGSYVRLAIVEEGRQFAGNFKPLNENGQQWELEITSSMPEAEVQIQLKETNRLPEGFHIYILDKEAQQIIAVNENRFSVKLSRQSPARRLSVLIGTQQFAEQNAENISLVPIAFALYPNFPNPFNPETVIQYQVPRPDHIRLEIFNLMGQKVRTLVDRHSNPGLFSVKWEGLDDAGRPVSSGIYFYRLTSSEFTAMRKLVLSR